MLHHLGYISTDLSLPLSWNFGLFATPPLIPLSPWRLRLAWRTSLGCRIGRTRQLIASCQHSKCRELKVDLCQAIHLACPQITHFLHLPHKGSKTSLNSISSRELYQAFSFEPPTSSQIMTLRLISFECSA